jgi:hypothetical protein
MADTLFPVVVSSFLIRLSSRVDESALQEAYERAQPLFISFIDHFISLSTREAPLPVEPDSADPVLIAKRDHTIRSRMFSPVADPMWMNIAKMVGQEAADGMRHTLATL